MTDGKIVPTREGYDRWAEISDYVMGAVKAGLEVLHVSEHLVGKDLVERAPRAERYLDWPMLFMMKLTPGD